MELALAPGSLLHELDRSLRALGDTEAGLVEQQVACTEQWKLRRSRVYADPVTGRAGTGPYVEFEHLSCGFDLLVPEGVVAMTFVANGNTVRWMRGRKAWQQSLGLIASDPRQKVLWFDVGSYPTHLSDDQWTTRVARPVEVRAAMPVVGPDTAGSVTTGCVVPLLESNAEGGQTLAVLLLAKADTRFRRVGQWGLAAHHLIRLPPPFAELLLRGRYGEING